VTKSATNNPEEIKLSDILGSENAVYEKAFKMVAVPCYFED